MSSGAKSEGGAQADSEGCRIAKLGEAAIAVNEAEDQLLEIAEGLGAGKSSQGLLGAMHDLKGESDVF